MALLLHAELDLTLLLLQPVALLQRLSHGRVALARLLERAIGCGNTGSILQKSFAHLDFLLEFLLALARTALLKFQAILLGRDRLLQRCLTLLQRGVFFGLSAIHTLLLSELLQRLIAYQDRALLLQDGFVVRHTALVRSQLLVHFE